MRRWIPLALLLSSAVTARSQTNLLSDPGMEDPKAWDSVIIGNPAEAGPDTAVKHAGRQSMRISATDTARAYARSKPIPVAPGERLRAAVWVKFADVPQGPGTVIAIAEWTGIDGRGLEVSKVDVAKRDSTSSDWQHITGTLEVPANAANLRLRLGFSYSQGTCWWDDATVTAEGGRTSVRVDLPTAQLTPAMETLPLTIINRQAAKGPAKLSITAGKATADADITLTGEQVQTATAPLPLGRQRGKVPVEVSLTRAGNQLASTTFQGQVPPAIVFPPLSPTHWCVEDGPPRFTASPELHVAKADRAPVILKILDSTGKERLRKELTPAGATEIILPSAPQGDYRVVVESTGPGGAAISAEQPWSVIPRRLAKVTFNSEGYPVYDGRAFFPLGIFNGARFDEQGKAGFTVSHAYNATRVFPGRDPQDQAAKNFLDRSHQNGMKMLFMVPLKLAEEGDWDGFRRRIRMFKNHPGLLAWDEEEGLARGDWKRHVLDKAYQIVKEEDPHHPFMVGDACDVITKARGRVDFFPADSMDLGMWWWYPLPLRERANNALEGEEASTGTTLQPPPFLKNRGTNKPLWVGVQSYKKNGPDQRYPTPVEYRMQAYYGIIAGAQGLMWYGGSVTGGMFLDMKAADWEYVQTLAKELHSLEWAWLSPTTQKWDEIDGRPVSGIVKKGPKGTLVVAVNRGNTPVDVTLPVQGTAEVLNENRRAALGGKEHFDAYGVHVYMLP